MQRSFFSLSTLSLSLAIVAVCISSIALWKSYYIVNTLPPTKTASTTQTSTQIVPETSTKIYHYDLHDNALFYRKNETAQEVMIESDIDKKTTIKSSDYDSHIFAEPSQGPYLYLYDSKDRTIFQYDTGKKKFARMSWYIDTFGPLADLLTHDNNFMLGYNYLPDQSSLEMRSLRLTDLVNGTQKIIEPLVAPATYTGGQSEFDGSPVTFMQAIPLMNTFEVPVYLDNPEVKIFDQRYSISKKIIVPSSY